MGSKHHTTNSQWYGSSGEFDGTGYFLEIADNADFDQDGDFTPGILG